MIAEMKKLGDKGESYYYKKMNQERKDIKRKAQKLNQEHKGICERLNQSTIKKAKKELEVIDGKTRKRTEKSIDRESESKSRKSHSVGPSRKTTQK